MLSRTRGLLRETFVGTPETRLAAARGRTAVLNQLLLCAIVLLVSVLSLFIGERMDRPLFLVGVLGVFLGGAATLLIPWALIPRGWILLVPLADIVAIAALRHAEPDGGLGLLWAFPAIWLAALGTLAFVAQFLVITSLYWTVVAIGPNQGVVYATFLLPIVILAIATTIFVSTRRYQAQQSLLDKQAVLLSGALQRTQRQEELVTEVLDAVDFGVLRVSPEGTVAVVNEALGRFQQSIPGFGVSDRELRNAYRADGTTPLTQAERPLARAIRGEVFDNQVVWFGHPDERRTAMSMTVRRMRDAFGVDAGAVLIARDITAELTALRARDRLVASVSHELRTPLTSVLGYIDLAMDNLDRPDLARKDLEIAGRNSERLLEIVSDILAASSSSRLSVDMTISPENVDVAEIVRASAEAWRPRAAERTVTIVTAGVEPARAFADPLRLRQVIDNLVSNAVKYNRDGGEVSLGCTTDGVETWILVRDTGSGIPAADQERLFERYFRARTDVGGTGLGLSISRDIARAHGGDITVRSDRGVGSTFMVQLPATADGLSSGAPEPRDGIGDPQLDADEESA
ncbi:PAS domain-containing sensor histidine kinase [Microbacterium sp. 18062]|uniref:PAS domain-containing sensor histidine kinase n=1 Tax=Microbacterium sp. 18062 TaxID=2681410 RepID=UPI00135ACDDA|nr:PAS domain-containing sensor histidine kinase [Microbacterium sp. 18062]